MNGILGTRLGVFRARLERVSSVCCIPTLAVIRGAAFKRQGPYDVFSESHKSSKGAPGCHRARRLQDLGDLLPAVTLRLFDAMLSPLCAQCHHRRRANRRGTAFDAPSLHEAT